MIFLGPKRRHVEFHVVDLLDFLSSELAVLSQASVPLLVITIAYSPATHTLKPHMFPALLFGFYIHYSLNFNINMIPRRKILVISTISN